MKGTLKGMTTSFAIIPLNREAAIRVKWNTRRGKAEQCQGKLDENLSEEETCCTV